MSSKGVLMFTEVGETSGTIFVELFRGDGVDFQAGSRANVYYRSL